MGCFFKKCYFPVTDANFNCNGGTLETVHGVSIGWKTRWHCLLSWICCCTWFSTLTASHLEGYPRPCSWPPHRMAGQSTSYGSFMPGSNTPTCDFKILMTLRTCCTPSDLGYRTSVVLFCAILLTLCFPRSPLRDTQCIQYTCHFTTQNTTLLESMQTMCGKTER